VNTTLILLLTYTAAVTAFGVWVGRRVKGASDFFVAGRSLSWPLVASTVLAANIGAGTTVGTAGVAYRDGISAWWWNGSVGLGTLALAFWVGPRLWKLASDRGYFTLGDYLEDRFNGSVRGLVAALLAIGTLAILAGQLIAGAAILEVVAGTAKWQGVVIGGVAMTLYFTAGGLLSSAWVNAVQLFVLLAGLMIAVPLALSHVGGIEAIAAAPSVPATYFDPLYSAGGMSGWTMFLLLAPGFVISPGLVQKAFGAVDAKAVRLGIGVAGVAQLIFSFVPVLLGMAARVNHPGLTDPNIVLPTVVLNDLPVWFGALGLAAIFSAEVSTCDAILFMLSTSVSKDVYQRFVDRAASPDRVLRVARIAAVAGGVLGMFMAIQLSTVADALRIFYSLLIATLFVPVVGGLVFKQARSSHALVAIACGMGTMLAVYFLTDGKGWWDPGTWGLAGSAVGFAVVLLATSRWA
jgi:SSS family solute:Na+ symporter